MVFKSALVVDDNEVNRYYLKALLEAHGRTVETAENGREALLRAREVKPDLVISDLLMPVMDGFGLLSEWTEDPALRRIPFVVYTGTFTTPEDRQFALHLGAEAFLVKPMEPEPLLMELEKAVSEFSPERYVALDQKLEFSRRHADILVRKLTQRNRDLERERQALNREVKEKEALLDALTAKVALLDAHGRILRVNQSWREFVCERDVPLNTFGVGAPYVETLQNLVGDATCDGEINERLEEVISGLRESYFIDYQTQGETDKSWYRMIATSLGGEGLGALAMHVDITEQKRLEAQLLRAQRLESVGTLASGLAHDLNNGLLPILVAVDLLKDPVSEQTKCDLLNSIERSASRGRDLIRQLLVFARGTDDGRKPVSLLESVQEVYHIAKETFPKRISVEASFTEVPLMVEADATQLHQVFLNLCVNARDAISGNGRITIKAYQAAPEEVTASFGEPREGEFGCVEVSDTGSGMSEAVLQRIFEPFFTTKEIGKGTGLGLPTSRSIVESHGGRICVDSKPGEGTTFRICLPVRKTELSRGKLQKQLENYRGEGQTLLVVDDEATIRDLVKKLLEAGGYKVVGARNGVEALSIFKNSPEKFAAVITDKLMPGMDGPELVQEMRSVRGDLKVLACSGLDTDSESWQHGQPSQFLNKPFTARELLRAVKQLLEPTDQTVR